VSFSRSPRPVAISFKWLSSLTLTVGPPTARTIKAVAILQLLRSYKTREMACDMHVGEQEEYTMKKTYALALFGL
jgi:hypothetical protein